MSNAITPASRGRRKVRMLRDERPPDDLVVLVRAAPASVAETVADITEAALDSSARYVVGDEGSREILFGVSVFAVRDADVSAVLGRFRAAPTYLAVAVGVLRAAEFPVLSTGTNPAHFDVQLLTGRADPDETSVLRDRV